MKISKNSASTVSLQLYSGSPSLASLLSPLKEELAIDYGGHTVKQTISAGVSEIIER
ncbi:hypothetical protein [Oceanospirillum beijerinckii]|uniref:hypothetical protein n=1 Tax=Oceanospirillum beijerinckii TaxID=64976 RepID=UPI0003FC4F84|nr:hypothetical protein [Oceanospirillum beijerinckii]